MTQTRTLILGFDGGDREVFDAFDMPFLENLMAQGQNIPLREDLLSRGWSEILTGRLAEHTGGLYFRPLPKEAEKKPVLNDKYSLKEMLADPAVTPLWTMLNARGHRMGMIGVPTTTPAPQIDGFTVSGGGGGVNKIDGIPDGFCHPKEIASILEETRYEFDVRLSTMPEKTFPEFIRRVEEVVSSNTRAAIALDAEYRPEVLFLCLRPTTGLQYLARYDIHEAAKAGKTGPAPSENVAMLRRHYAFLDDQIRQIFEAVAPDRFILTADHGTAPYRKRVNVNAALLELGFQSPRAKAASGLKSTLRRVKKMLPRSFVSRYGKTVRKSLGGMELNFDPQKTQAFGNHHIRGVYCNDEERFGGPVKADEVEALTDRICEALNADPRLMAEGISARPFRRLFEGASQTWQLPDIELDAPDTAFFLGVGPLIEDNPNWVETPRDLSFAHNPFSGTKGATPLMCVDAETAALVSKDTPRDLRMVHHLVDRIYAP